MVTIPLSSNRVRLIKQVLNYLLQADPRGELLIERAGVSPEDAKAVFAAIRSLSKPIDHQTDGRPTELVQTTRTDKWAVTQDPSGQPILEVEASFGISLTEVLVVGVREMDTELQTLTGVEDDEAAEYISTMRSLLSKPPH